MRSAGLDVRLVRNFARDRYEEAGLDVQRTLRLAGRPRRVREQVRMLGIDLPRSQITGRAVDELVPEAVAAECHRHIVETEAPPNDRVRDRRRRFERLVGDLLHRHHLPAPKRAVGRDQRFGLRVREPRGDRRSGEAGEDREPERHRGARRRARRSRPAGTSAGRSRPHRLRRCRSTRDLPRGGTLRRRARAR